jgi:hypothetical protein
LYTVHNRAAARVADVPRDLALDDLGDAPATSPLHFARTPAVSIIPKSVTDAGLDSQPPKLPLAK